MNRNMPASRYKEGQEFLLTENYIVGMRYMLSEGTLVRLRVDDGTDWLYFVVAGGSYAGMWEWLSLDVLEPVNTF